MSPSISTSDQQEALNILAKDSSSPTEQEVSLAQKFDWKWTLALKILGADYIDLVLSLTSDQVVALDKISLAPGTWKRKKLSKEVIEFVQKITNYGQVEALQVLQEKDREKALSFTEAQGRALATICSIFSPQGYHLRYREVREEDIVLAQK